MNIVFQNTSKTVKFRNLKHSCWFLVNGKLCYKVQLKDEGKKMFNCLCFAYGVITLASIDGDNDCFEVESENVNIYVEVPCAPQIDEAGIK
jgi:hypothetical protein